MNDFKMASIWGMSARTAMAIIVEHMNNQIHKKEGSSLDTFTTGLFNLPIPKFEILLSTREKTPDQRRNDLHIEIEAKLPDSNEHIRIRFGQVSELFDHDLFFSINHLDSHKDPNDYRLCSNIYPFDNNRLFTTGGIHPGVRCRFREERIRDYNLVFGAFAKTIMIDNFLKIDPKNLFMKSEIEQFSSPAKTREILKDFYNIVTGNIEEFQQLKLYSE